MSHWKTFAFEKKRHFWGSVECRFETNFKRRAVFFPYPNCTQAATDPQDASCLGCGERIDGAAPLPKKRWLRFRSHNKQD